MNRKITKDNNASQYNDRNPSQDSYYNNYYNYGDEYYDQNAVQIKNERLEDSQMEYQNEYYDDPFQNHEIFSTSNGASEDNASDKIIIDHEDVLLIIRLRGHEYKHLFTGKATNNLEAWRLIISQLKYQYPLKAISKKWSNLVQKYKRLKDPLNASSTEEKNKALVSWPYFSVMDEVFLNDETPPVEPAISSSEPMIDNPTPGPSEEKPKTSKEVKPEQKRPVLKPVSRPPDTISQIPKNIIKRPAQNSGVQEPSFKKPNTVQSLKTNKNGFSDFNDEEEEDEMYSSDMLGKSNSNDSTKNRHFNIYTDFKERETEDDETQEIKYFITEEDVLRLIQLRGVEYRYMFKSKCYNSKDGWKIIASKLSNRYPMKIIMKKWSNLFQKYKRLVQLMQYYPNDEQAKNAPNWQYFSIMGDVLKNDVAAPPQFEREESPVVVQSTSTSSGQALSRHPTPAACEHCGRVKKSSHAKKRNKYRKVMLEQNNRMLNLMNEFIITNGGNGFAGKVEVSLSDLSSDDE